MREGSTYNLIKHLKRRHTAELNNDKDHNTKGVLVFVTI